MPSKSSSKDAFSEYVTNTFDLDITKVSIITQNSECKIVFNNGFRVFIADDAAVSDFLETNLATGMSIPRYLKYMMRLREEYVILPPDVENQPHFDMERLLTYHSGLEKLWADDDDDDYDVEEE